MGAYLAALLLLTLATACAAPPPIDRSAPEPGVVPLPYDGSLPRFQGLRDTPAGDWRQANDRVREIGGWRAYARERFPRVEERR